MAREITERDLANKGVSGLPDVPGLTTEAMQKKFDEISKELLVPRFNEMVQEVNGLSDTVNEVNSNLNKKIKVTTITGSTGTGSGAGLLSIPRTEYPNAIAIIPFAYDFSFGYRIGAYDISSNNFKFGVQKSLSGEWADTVTVAFYALVVE